MDRRRFGRQGVGKRLMQAVALSALALAACHAPGRAGMSVAQVEARWEGLPVKEADTQAYAVTLYADGWGLVNETATMALDAGDQIVRFSPVAPHTEGRGAYLQVPATVTDRRFRYDLATKERLMERYHGRTVVIVTATGSITATLLMTESGPVYRVGDSLMVVDPPGRVIFPPIPELAAEPMLEWIVRLSAAWSGPVTASYVVNRLGWQSEYILITNAVQSQGDWTHWASLTNQSGGRFPDAQVTLVAGDVRREDRPIPMPYGGARAYADAVPAESFAARYQYRLPQPLTLERNVEQRVTLGNSPQVALERSFRLTSYVNLYRIVEPELPRKALLRLTIPNTEAAGLGKPMPRGKVTVYTPNPQGKLAIAGEPSIPDTPKGQAIILELGEAFDVTAERRQTLYEITGDGTRIGYRIILRNQQEGPVTVDVIEQIPADWTLESNSHPYERPSANELRFRPTVPAGGEVELNYVVTIRTQTPPPPVPGPILRRNSMSP